MAHPMARRAPLSSPCPQSAMLPAIRARRRQPVILKRTPPLGARCAEVAGGTTADCVAVCCCFPCVAVNVVVLTAVRLPAGICRKAMRARRARRRMRRQARLLGNKASDDTSTVAGEEESESEEAVVGLTPEEMEEVERAMWLRFHGAGFWRSPSQLEEPNSMLIA